MPIFFNNNEIKLNLETETKDIPQQDIESNNLSIFDGIGLNLESETKDIPQQDIESNNLSIFDGIGLNKKDNGEISTNNTQTNIEKTSITNFSFKSIIGTIINWFDGNTKDGEIGDTYQRLTGDCFLLSAINSLSYTEKGQEIIKNALDYQNDGSIIAHFATGDVVVTQNEINYTKGGLTYSFGDDDMIIMELAIEKTYKDIAAGKIDLPEELCKGGYRIDDNGISSGGSSIDVYYILTGQISDTISTETENKKYDVLNYFEENGGKDFASTAGISYGEAEKKVVKDVNGKKVKLPCHHAYAIKNVEGNTVTVVNPWDSSKEIVLSKETFTETFDVVNPLDLSGENKFEKWVAEQDKNREIINGIRYTSEYEYDKNGNVTGKRVHTNNGDTGIKYTYDKDGNTTVKLYDIDENGEITEKWRISEEAAQKIIERGLLNIKPEYTAGFGLSNDIYVSELWKGSDEKWQILKDYFVNIPSDRINLQDLGKYANLDIEIIEKGLHELNSNEELPAGILYLKLAGLWTEEEFQNYLEEHNIEYKEYKAYEGISVNHINITPKLIENKCN